MAWELEIHHLDVVGTGDSTLIIAREPTLNIVRSCLIDGGLAYIAPAIDQYITVALRQNPLNVMVCTHYDKDHVRGLIELLLMAVNRYATLRIYDQGWPLAIDTYYVNYVRAIEGYPATGNQQLGTFEDINLNRVRVTAQVSSDGVAIPPVQDQLRVALPAGGEAAIVQPPQWLLNRDVLWDGYPGGRPDDAPSMRCIAVNQYVETAPGNPPPYARAGGMGIDLKNQKSLAFQLQFNNFKYYIGGDIESEQEDLLLGYLNANDNVAGRVLTFKPSHHGANTATSRVFVDRLRPLAAFISCGTHNQHTHPAWETVNVLDGFPAIAGVLHRAVPPARPYRGIRNYLTGYDQIGPPPVTGGGDTSVSAGNPVQGVISRFLRAFGDIVLLVSEPQSQRAVEGRLGTGVATAAETAATTAGATPAAATRAYNYTMEAVVYSGNQATASAVAAMLGIYNVPIATSAACVGAIATLAAGPNPGVPQDVANEVTMTLTNNGVPANISTPVAAAVTVASRADNKLIPNADGDNVAQLVVAAVLNADAGARIAAAAGGAAAGAAYELGLPEPAGEAVTAALNAAGFAPNAQAAGANAAQTITDAIAGGLFDVMFYDLNNTPPGRVLKRHS